MKVMYLTGYMPGCVGKHIYGEAYANDTGAWAQALAELIIRDTDIELVCVYGDRRGRVSGRRGRLSWYAFHAPKVADTACDRKRQGFFRDIILQEKPDLVHIWGTEYVWTLEMLRAAEGLAPCVISLQGLISACAKVYTKGLMSEAVSGRTFHDMVRGDGIAETARRFALRGEAEKEALLRAKAVIGRTSWDRSVVCAINPDADYHRCEELIRPVFLKGRRWSYEECEKHSLFMSQASYPIKGMHMALEIVRRLKESYPDVHLYTTGRSAVCKSMSDRLRQNSYERYLSRRISEYSLDDNVTWLGHLDAAGMREQYLKANVFLLPSLVENSSNSLTEAMALDTPFVATDTGGTPDMVGDAGRGRLFEPDDTQRAVMLIDEIFKQKEAGGFEDFRRLGEVARASHNEKKILMQYMNCYEDVIRKDTYRKSTGIKK